MDYLLVPIHCSGNHWTSAVIDMKKKQVEYYDSLLGNNPKCFLVGSSSLLSVTLAFGHLSTLIT